MDTFFIKLKDNKDSVVEIKRQAESISDIENLIKEEFPECKIVTIKMLLLD